MKDLEILQDEKKHIKYIHEQKKLDLKSQFVSQVRVKIIQ